MPVNDFEPRQGIDMGATAAAPLCLGGGASFLHVISHDEYHFVVFTHAAHLELASQVRGVEVHVGSVASTKGK
jgi:hypothetical protein